MHCVCMATKTISIDEKAYERLSMARLTPGESFSRVIHRMEWKKGDSGTGTDLLRLLEEPSGLSDSVLDELEENQKLDLPPTDPWDA